MKKYKIGYTSGVYDMFHIGHLNILKKAKEQCDYLIVAVSTDELVLKEKNKKTIIPFDERVEIVKAIKYVDEVVPQFDKDKFGAWEKYHFNVMFVGDDWKGKVLFKQAEEKLSKVNVDVVYFPYTKHISSTLIREKLNNINKNISKG
ncbi:MAG: adenylyltransferase/cytidyltransferase family protein [Clostridia bacterium]|nr:adenylyltransferase/cytidyltransferase family protein [Clostridia bacterium]